MADEKSAELEQKMFHLKIKLEFYKQTREDTRKVFEQAFVFSNNAMRGLFIVSAGSAIALINATVKEEARNAVNCHIAYFAACAALCAVCAGISYVAQSLFTRGAYSYSNDILSTIYGDSWPPSKSTKRFHSWANFVNCVAVALFSGIVVVYGWRLFGIYRLVVEGKM